MDISIFVARETILTLKKMIPVKIITKEKAIKLGLIHPSSTVKTGGASINVVLTAIGKIGKKEADKIEIINIKTGEKKVLFDKGKKNIFKGFDKK